MAIETKVSCSRVQQQKLGISGAETSNILIISPVSLTLYAYMYTIKNTVYTRNNITTALGRSKWFTDWILTSLWQGLLEGRIYSKSNQITLFSNYMRLIKIYWHFYLSQHLFTCIMWNMPLVKMFVIQIIWFPIISGSNRMKYVCIKTSRGHILVSWNSPDPDTASKHFILRKH